MFHDLRLSSVRVPIGAETLSGDLGVPSTPRGLVIFAGAAAAIVAAAARPRMVAAVVSRGGRSDLAGAALRIATAPTLLLVGSRDPVVIELNRDAGAGMRAEGRLEIVPGATHLFEEPGALKHVTRRAGDWFEQYLHPTTAASGATSLAR